MWKKVLAIIVASMVLFSSGVYAGTILKQYKTPRGNVVIVEETPVHKGRVGLVVNGKEIKQQTWYENSVTYVPLRAVSEALGAKVAYDAKTMVAEITLPEPKTEVQVVEKIVYVDSSTEIYEGKYYDLTYVKSLNGDFELGKKYADEAIQIGLDLYEGRGYDFEQALISGKLDVSINLATNSNVIGKMDGNNKAQGSSDYMDSDIEVMTPSISIGECCGNHKHEFDESTFRRLIIHEVLHSFQMYHQEQYWGKAWYPENMPTWLKEGFIEYVSMKETNQLNILRHNVENGKYNTTYKFYEDKLDVSNPYTHGTLFTYFLDEKYGMEAIFDYIDSPKKTSAEAFNDVFGMTFIQAGKEFAEWQSNLR